MAVDETKRIITHGDGQEIADGLANIALAIHSTATGGETEITSWPQVQRIVRSGLAPRMFSVGDTFTVERETAINATASGTGVTGASVDADTFLAHVGEAGNKDYEFEYDGAEWKGTDGEPAVLSAYGITVTGTPAEGDRVVVHETASDIEFVVMGFDQETPADATRTHSMTLAMRYTFAGVQFDEREAFYYNGTSAALPAGTYHFALVEHSWYPADVGKSFQLTLTQALPVGGQLVFTQAYNATLVGAKVNVFASNAATSATESVTLSEGTDGTDLGSLRNSFADGSYMNHCQRALMGNNRWSQSAIRQWCNGDGAKGTFWTPQNKWDRAPSWNGSLDAFLKGVDPSLTKVIGYCSKDTELASCDGGGHETTSDRVWLLSRYEIQSCSAAEAATYPPYTWWHDLLGSTYGDWRTDTRFIKLNKKGGSAQYWWLRSPSAGDGTNARSVYAGGNVNGNIAVHGIQAAVALSII